MGIIIFLKAEQEMRLLSSILVVTAVSQKICISDNREAIEDIDPDSFGVFIERNPGRNYDYYFASDEKAYQKDNTYGQTYFLGSYSRTEWSEESKTLTRYYENGHKCGSKPRQVKVISRCGDATTLNSVTEPRLCEYVWDITVDCCKTPLVPVPYVNKCNNDDGEMILDVTLSGVEQSPGEGWNADDKNTYSRVYAANNPELKIKFVEDNTGKYLHLTKELYGGDITDCVGFVNQDGEKVCFEADAAAFMFTCIYDLADQTLDDNYVVGPANITHSEAIGTGSVNYILEVEEEVAMGDVIKFQIIPKTPNVVFATVKSCTVKQGANNNVPIFGYNNKPMCFLEPAEAGWTNDASSLVTIDGYWRSFQWYDNGVLEKEPQSLVCTIGLSGTKNPDTPEACDFSG